MLLMQKPKISGKAAYLPSVQSCRPSSRAWYPNARRSRWTSWPIRTAQCVRPQSLLLHRHPGYTGRKGTRESVNASILGFQGKLASCVLLGPSAPAQGKHTSK